MIGYLISHLKTCWDSFLVKFLLSFKDLHCWEMLWCTCMCEWSDVVTSEVCELILHIDRDEIILSFMYCLTILSTNMKPITYQDLKKKKSQSRTWPYFQSSIQTGFRHQSDLALQRFLSRKADRKSPSLVMFNCLSGTRGLQALGAPHSAEVYYWP